MTLWSDFNFGLTEPQKDYLNELKEYKDLEVEIKDIQKAIDFKK